MHDIVTLGSATVDVFVETEKQTAAMQDVNGKSEPFITFRSGEKVLIKHLQFEVGGGGTNTAACFAKLGFRTAYLGTIGNDTNGALVLENLKGYGIDFIGTRTDDLTNYSIVLESKLLQDRTILVYKGASEHLIHSAAVSPICRWLYVSALAGESFRTAQRVIDERKAQGTKVAFNPSNYQIEHDRDAVKAMAAKADILILNREEAALLVGDGTERELLERIRALGPTTVAITMGAKGVAVTDGAQWLRAYPTPNIPVRETTGAGDCFAATLVGALAAGRELETALRWGLVNVETHIQHVGAKAGILTRSELEFAALRDGRPILPL
jgi:ribokinase